MSNIKTQTGKVIGRSLNAYHSRVKPKIDELKFKESYQGKIIDCMVGEVDDNYIETPETDAPIVKLEHSKEGLVKIPTIKGKTILVDADGNETDTPAEGCKLVSVGEAEDNKMIILSNNPNLYSHGLRKGSWKYGVDTKYNVFDENAKGVSDRLSNIKPIKIKPNTTYKFIFEGSTNINLLHCFFYDENGDYFNDINFKNTIYGKVTSPDGAYYMCFFSGNDVADINYKFMLTEDENIVEYVEHKSHKTEILLDEPLRRISDTVYDVIQGNSITYNTVKKVLDGSEDWRNFNNGFIEKTETIDVYFINNQKHNTNVLCDTFPKVNSTYLHDVEGISGAGGSGTNIWVSVAKSRLETPDRDGFKKWLKENPITIIYELEEPIIEELPNGITLQGYDDTTMYIENSITPTVSYGYNALIPYKKELSKQKEEVETNTLDIENNIIPYLMDMEFNLMLMEDNE